MTSEVIPNEISLALSGAQNAQLDTLKRARSARKAKITRLGSWLDSITCPDDTDLEEAQVRLSALLSSYKEFESIQDQIDETLYDEQDSLTQRGKMEEQFYHLKAIFTRLVNCLTPSTEPILNSPSQSETNNSASNNINFMRDNQPVLSPLPTHLQDVRLPSISLPTFSGDCENFSSFSELFKALVDENTQLSNIARFYYLKSSLRGPALEVISNLPMTNENYSLAWTLLTDRYLSIGTAVEKLHTELLSLPVVTSENPVALRRLLDASLRIIRTLKVMKIIIDDKDAIYVTIVSSKIDLESRRAFKLSLSSSNIVPTFNDLYNFLDRRLKALESLVPMKRDFRQGNKTTSLLQGGFSKEPFSNKTVRDFNNRSGITNGNNSHFRKQPFSGEKKDFNSTFKCTFCGHISHRMAQCPEYKKLTITERKNFIITQGLCLNCLSKQHQVRNCSSRYVCRFCSVPHHSSICTNNTPANGPAERVSNEAANRDNQNNLPSVSLLNNTDHSTAVLLSTAQVLIEGADGTLHPARALIDSGSEGHFLTEKLANQLNLSRVKTDIKISGIGSSYHSSKHRVHARIHSRFHNYSKNLELFILPQIAMPIPSHKINTDGWRIPENINLADETFYLPSNVDILIGNHIFFDSLYKGRIPATPYRPALIHTKFGWLWGGNIPHTARSRRVHVHLTLAQQVEQLWKLDECAASSPLTEEEKACEEHFCKTHTRNSEGRYVVRLPFRREPHSLGTSRNQCRRRWLSVENRLSRDVELRKGYTEFMNTYLNLGHMSLLGSESDIIESREQYHLPHHPVFKLDSSSTQLRVVFDASSKTSNSLSLNDIMMTGPKTQSDLFHILLRFRLHKYVFTSDISKMYRQVLVHESDRKHQMILWRESTTSSLNVYQLNTVTYGMSAAPFLATRCLVQLADDERKNFPIAARAVRDFYVDDLISGNDNLQQALKIQTEMIDMLATAGFPLLKWSSNNAALLENIPPEHREPLVSLNIASSDVIKALGLLWLPNEDYFIYDASKISKKVANTKRQVLSQLASLFDPMGLLAPVVAQAKIFMQTLWQQNLDWDDPLPNDLRESWNTFSISLHELPNLKVPRHASGQPKIITYELHGFSDACPKAYGCAIYLRTINSSDEVSVKLLCARSRVSPQKQLSLPRLELSAALLLTRLMNIVLQALDIAPIQHHCWCDSQIVLAWIAGHSYQWKTFVANRVAEIQDFATTWHYIPTDKNPADLISRGCSVAQLQNSPLWWGGPSFLHNFDYNLQDQTFDIHTIDPPERKASKVNVATSINTSFDIFTRYSSVYKLVNITAWIFRFFTNCKSPSSRISGNLTVVERDHALTQLLKCAQRETFSQELHDITAKGHTSKKSKLRQLMPFLDEAHILRVGGRLKHTTLSHSRKHPIILPPSHHLTTLLIRQAHVQCLHAGPQLVLATLQQRYWIINGRNVIRKLIHSCISCFKAKPTNSMPPMGQLPNIRIDTIRPFYNTGVDFAGPFFLRPPTRSNLKLKCYVSVFVCMATKCVHLELVGSLSAENFIAALTRFVARRGLCRSISSDNAKNFVGAKNVFKEIQKFLSHNSDKISQHLATKNIQWYFIPPVSPHTGGLWESAVRAMKHHLRRVAGLALLTYEEFSTLLCSIEACLNSRPLTALSTDPSDLQALTPGHFLIGTALLSPPSHDYTDKPMSYHTRWQRVQASTQHFWRRWSAEYISTLQPCAKWTDATKPLLTGQLVLIKEDNLPPLQWRLGRITDTHPGQDGVTRVLTIKTTAGIITRTAHRLFPLPILD